MKRSGFASQWQKRPEPVEKVARILTPIRQLITREAATLPLQTPKFDYVRSPKLLRACGAISCQHCDSDAGSCAAHSNWSIPHGKGRGIKASDVFVAAMCMACHSKLDQGNEWTNEEKQSIWHRAHVKTVQKLVILKLWPMEVPIPSLEWPEQWT